jgi:hypothetical protein
MYAIECIGGEPKPCAKGKAERKGVSEDRASHGRASCNVLDDNCLQTERDDLLKERDDDQDVRLFAKRKRAELSGYPCADERPKQQS